MQAPLRLLGVATVAAVSSLVASSASASVIAFNQQFVWESYVTAQGNAILLEDFNDIADGFYSSPFSQSVGSVTWTATAGGGLFAFGGQLSTNNPEALTFTFGPDVRGVGGNFFGTDINFNVVPSIATVSLSNGTSYVGLVNAATAYTGFYATSAFITAITISAAPASGSPAVYPTVDNLQFAVVPTPGALALLGLAGLAGARRRR
jgi:MYXO-CTERM domain-containing protein